jgi:hypothetical protein
VSDLARLELAVGDLGACLKVSQPELVPSPGHLAAELADPDTSPALRSLREVGKRCRAALEKRYAFLHAKACFGARCPRLVQAANPHEASSPVACPHVELTAARGAAAVELGATAGPLVDDGFCCGLARVRAGVQSGARFLRVRSDGAVSSCDGGEAKSVLDAVYVLEDDNRLRLVADYSYALE